MSSPCDRSRCRHLRAFAWRIMASSAPAAGAFPCEPNVRFRPIADIEAAAHDPGALTVRG